MATFPAIPCLGASLLFAALQFSCVSRTQVQSAPQIHSTTEPAVPVSDPAEYAIEHVSEDAGEAIFARTGIGDPYRTGIPYPIFLALLSAYPNELGGALPSFTTRFGFTPRAANSHSSDRDVHEGLPLGMHLTTDPYTEVPFVVNNCALCHAEVVRWPGGERLVMGIGNKRIRIHAYDAALATVAARPDFDAAHLAPIATEMARTHGVPWPAEYRHAFMDATLQALRERVATRAHFLDRVRDGLPGRVATIESFSVALGNTLHREIGVSEHVGWTRIPDVIGFAHRRTLSWDGAGEGSLDALAVEADLAAGARVEWLWQHPWQGPSLSAYLRQIPRDLRFPGPIDTQLAQRGRVTFERVCARCHGTYNSDGRSDRYIEHVVSVDEVGTDPAREEAVTDDLIAASEDPVLNARASLVRVRRTSGYVPPVLTSVWARAPYGHNGQWPSLWAIAQPPVARPSRYIVHSNAPLDLEHVGVTTGDASGPVGEGDYMMDTAMPGFHADGHTFLSDLGEAGAREVIEYLKTL